MKNVQKNMVIGLAAVCLSTAGLTGCSTWGNRSDGRSAGQAMDDSRLTGEVKTALSNEPVYKFNDVDVRTFNGVVQLSGFVTTDEQKQRAGQVAQQTLGVTRVVNNVTIKTMPTGRSSGMAPIINQTNAAPQSP